MPVCHLKKGMKTKHSQSTPLIMIIKFSKRAVISEMYIV